MAENMGHARSSYGRTPERRKALRELDQTTLSRDECLIFEQWLSDHLSKLYQDVLREPLPTELSDILESLKVRRRAQAGADRAAGPVAKPVFRSR